MRIEPRTKWYVEKRQSRTGGAITNTAHKKLVNHVFRLSRLLVRTAYKNQGNEEGVGLAKYWLGGGGDELAADLELMYSYFEVCTDPLLCHYSKVQNDLASCLGTQKYRVEDYGANWGKKRYQWVKGTQMMFGPVFFRVPLVKHRYTLGEKVGSFLHELSHVLLGTEDKLLINGKETYGAVMAKEYVTEVGGGARLNAENWCYYLTGFREHVSEGDFREILDMPKGALVGRFPLDGGPGKEWDMLSVKRVKWRTTTFPL
jgi:hypothetical protein